MPKLNPPKKAAGEPKPVKRRKPTQKRAKATVETILSVTAELIQKDGYYKLTTNRIAEHAGISIGSLYQYFPSREYIVYQLYEETLQKLATKMSRKTIKEMKKDVKTAIPALMAELLRLYKAEERILINLLEEVPELWSKTRTFSLEQLMREVNLTYFSLHQENHDPKEIEKNIFFVSTIILENLRKYLSQKPNFLPEKGFIAKLSKLVIFSLEEL